MTVVLDSSALLALLRGESGADAVLLTMRDPNNRCLVHALNLCEVFYVMHREYGESPALSQLAEMAALGLVTREDLDPVFWQDAARIKADYRRVSLADCCGIALTRRLDAQFLTADRHELEPIKAQGVCDIRFIR